MGHICEIQDPELSLFVGVCCFCATVSLFFSVCVRVSMSYMRACDGGVGGSAFSDFPASGLRPRACIIDSTCAIIFLM